MQSVRTLATLAMLTACLFVAVPPRAEPAGAASTQVPLTPSDSTAACNDCAFGDPIPTARSATLPVSLAILALGSLWLTLMVRRLQPRSAAGALRNVGPQHAAGGH